MEVITIIRRNFPKTVLKVKLKDLDKNHCSKKFLSHPFDENLEVYICCDKVGNIDYRGKNQEYRIYEIVK